MHTGYFQSLASQAESEKRKGQIAARKVVRLRLRNGEHARNKLRAPCAVCCVLCSARVACALVCTAAGLRAATLLWSLGKFAPRTSPPASDSMLSKLSFAIQAGWVLLFCKRLVCLPPVDRAAARTRRTGQCRATERAFHGGCHATSMRLRDRLKAPIPVSCLVRMDAALRVTPLKVAERRPKLAQDKSHLAGVWQEPPGIGQVGREAVDAVRLGCREARVP